MGSTKQKSILNKTKFNYIKLIGFGCIQKSIFLRKKHVSPKDNNNNIQKNVNQETFLIRKKNFLGKYFNKKKKIYLHFSDCSSNCFVKNFCIESIGMDVSPSNGEPKQSPIKPPIIHPRNFDINDIVVVVGFIDDIMDDLSLKNGQH